MDVYRQAIEAKGLTADVYDVDAHGGKAPTALGVLDHYRAVVWYTGDDVALADKEAPPRLASAAAHELQLAIRDYLDEGGRVLYAGGYAATEGSYQYDDGSTGRAWRK